MKLTDIEMRKIGKRTLALVLTGALTFSSASLALANESGEQSEELETVELLNDTDTNVAVTSEESAEESETVVEEAEDAESPSLVPGDFLYFVKIAMEKIKLALTFDDVKQAELLATYAGERLAEAEVLFNEGKEEEALEAIQNALEYIENAGTVVEENTDQESTEESASEDDVAAEEELDVEIVTEDEESVEESPIEEVEVALTQNIISLKANMKKIKNPKAKAALKRNIERAYAKLGLVYDETEDLESEEVVETEVDVETDVEAEVETGVDNEETALEEEEAGDLLPVDKQAKEAAKQQKFVEKQEAKQKREAAKQERKDSRKAAKEQRHENGKQNNGKSGN